MYSQGRDGNAAALGTSALHGGAMRPKYYAPTDSHSCS
jgi:hypothetical protein